MTPTLYLRRGIPADVDTIIEWRRQTAEWLTRAKGSEQWSVPYPRDRILHWIDQGATVMGSLRPGGQPIATATVSPDADPDLWTADELETPARYLYKLNVVREHAGKGIGAGLIDWATTRTFEAGIKVMRFDVWSTNTGLQRYYLDRGFRYLRTVPGTVSGALFEGPTAIVPDLPIIEADRIQLP